MVTKELIKTEIDKVQEEYLEALYKVVVAFGAEARSQTAVSEKDATPPWHAFIQETYGSLANDPIERGGQGTYEIRDRLE